jgi:hypothetical protein
MIQCHGRRNWSNIPIRSYKLIKHRAMELRGKLSQSGPKPAASQQRRRIIDNSHRENLLRMLIIEPNIENTAGHSPFPGKSRLLIKDKWWAKFSQNTSKIPLYVLETIYDEKYNLSIGPHSEMELVHEFIPQKTISLWRKCHVRVSFFCRHQSVRAKWPLLRSDEWPWAGTRSRFWGQSSSRHSI